MKKLTHWLGALLLVTLGLGNASAQQVIIGTGGTGGVYFFYGTQIAQIIGANTDLNATAIQTAASVDNNLLLRDKTNPKRGLYYCETSLPDTTQVAYDGTHEKFKDNPAPARILFQMYPNVLQIVTTEDSGIKNLSDLTGKRVSTGAPSSGTEYTTLNLLDVANVETGSFSKWARLGASESAEELSNGTLDAYFWSGGIPTGSITELATTLKRKGKKIALVSLNPEGDAVQAFEKEFPGQSSPITIDADVYGTDGDIQSLGFWNQFACPESLPEDAAYAITKAVFEHVDELAKSVSAARDTTIENNIKAIDNSGVPFHEGAIRYFKEAAQQ